jgi:diguanylate cyclase (GGDEF)-like protein/PAS domain S-box-containing protein
MNLQLLGLAWPHRFSLQAWLAIGFNTVIALTLVVAAAALLTQERFVGAVHKLLAVDGRIASLSQGSNIAMLKARRAEKDFLIYRREFGFDEAKSRYVTLLRTHLAEVRQNMAEIRGLTAEPEAIGHTQAIDRAVLQYEAGFLAIVDLYGTLGHFNTGFEGALRQKAREIEATLGSSGPDRLRANLFALRRHEKEFVLRGFDRQVDAFAQGVAHFRADIAAVSLSAERREELGRLANEYLGLFGQYVQTASRIDDEEAAYLAAAHAVEPVLEKLGIDAHRSELATRSYAERVGTIATGTISILTLLALLFGLTAARLVARLVSQSVDECLQFAKRVAQGDLRARLAPRGRHEFGTLAAALNDMTGALQAREAALEQAGAHVRESEERYRDLVENSSDLVCTHDLDGNLLSVNEAGMRLSGYSRDALLRMNLVDLLAPAVRGSFPAYLAEIRTQGAANGLMRVQTADGGLRWWEYHNTLRTEGVARPIVRGTSRDVTERMRAEKGLRESEAKLRAIFDNTVEGIFLVDAAGRVVSSNPMLARMLGYESPKQMGQEIRSVAREVYVEKGARRRFRELLDANRVVEDFETQWQRKDGSTFWVSLSARMIERESGGMIHHLGMARDITERRRAAAELEKLSLAVRQSGTAIVITDPAGQIEFVNPKFETMTGYGASEVQGQSPRILKSGATPPEVYRDLWATILAGKQWRGEITNRKKCGELYWESQHISPVLDESGKIQHFIAIKEDITARKQAEKRIDGLNRMFAVLSGINALIVRVRERDELLRGACRIAVEAGRFTSAWVGIVDDKTKGLRTVAHWGAPLEGLAEVRRLTKADLPQGRGFMGRALRERTVQIVNDVATDERMVYRSETLQAGFRSFAILPLVVDGEPVGVLSLLSNEVGFFDEEEMKLLRELGGDVAFALESIAKNQKLDYLAYYDPLTGLANRVLLEERLSQSISAATRGDGKLALVVADIERLKIINESLGRQAGDDLLRQFAKCLAGAAEPARVARISADQFALILPEVRGKTDATRQLEEMIQKCLAHPFTLNGVEVRISARLGVALYPNHAGDTDTLLRNAEMALRKAKETGERFAFYTSELTAGVSATLTLENQLRQALERDEFVLHYQPKVDLASGGVAGVEALIRWSSPELGLVPPAKFVPLLESTGLIQEVGAWALEKAVDDHLRWQALGLAAPRVAVNVSALQLRKRDFVSIVQEAIARGADPTGLDLEITESLVMRDVEGNIAKLRALHDLGVNVAIDDFGTGYSSLGYLAKLPVQALKIDRSFIITMLEDPNTMTLVSTMISLAHSLRLKVVAEGVDSEDQAKFLRLLRCEEMQGYLFSKPLPFDDMTALLRKDVRAIEKAYA